MNTITQRELIKLIEQWENTPLIVYKSKLKVLLDKVSKEKKIKKRSVIIELVKILDVGYEAVKSYFNNCHKSKIPFLNALKLSNYFGINVTELMK